ncbi:MAG: type VI secretion system ATPase TssH [Desulfobacteraceae bacterium]|nr:type VI secretion system ATPase TssH [Desulfobacteraceae bacterium]MBC2754355.1 type VI secretion system ATPase TssH [Desulfobacteraceae bacterium]
MITVDIKSLLGRLNTHCTRSLEAAAGLCVSRTHYEVTLEHMLSKLMDDSQSDLPLILRHFEIDPSRLKKIIDRALESLKTGNAAKPVFSPLLMDWFQEAWLVGSIDLGENRIRSGALILALLNRPTQFSSGQCADLLSTISKDALLSGFWEIVKGSDERRAESRDISEGEDLPADATALGRFCVDFTQKARDGEIDPVFGRDREIRQMVDILARRRKNNPIVVGEAGVGKTAVVEGLALRVVEEDVPDLLQGVAILGLDMGLLQAGAGMKGEFENRLKSVITEIKSSEKPIILFIDEAHTLIGAGGSAGMSDAANLLKPALARGELRTVAATTWSEYKKYFEKDAALARRFQLVKLDEPSEETAVVILRGLKSKYEEAHHVAVRDDAIQAAAELSSRYISGRQLPDKAVDLLDTSAARVKVLLTAKPDVIEDKERSIQNLEREKSALERDKLNGFKIDEERVTEINSGLANLKSEIEQLNERWIKEKELAKNIIEYRKSLYEMKSAEETSEEKENELASQMEAAVKELETLQSDYALVHTEVDPDVVSKVVSDWTGVPLGKLMRDEAQNIINLEDNLKQRIKGQDEAMGFITEVIKSAKAGIKDPSQPLGVFLLAGPSGVGKTETGLAIADLLFGGENFMVTVNMSEFQEKHTVSRLIGSPPGYVGFGEGGVLTEAVRQRPYSVVLLDEVEKGHLEVLNLFYQVFDKGMLSDGEGRLIDFKNTVIFLTSNLATDVITEMCSGDEIPPLEIINQAVRPILSNHFKPALLARMTVLPFLTLKTDILKDIVALKMNKLVKRLAETHKMTLTYSDDVVNQIAARCTEVETGARNIDYIMTGSIMPRMSQEILTRMTQEEMPSQVHLGLSKEGTFDISFNNALKSD